MNTRTLESEACHSSFYDHVELFLHQLRAAGYAEHTLGRKRFALRGLAQWAEGKGITITDLRDRHVAIFLKRSSGRVKDFVAGQRRAIQQFLRFIRSATGEASPSVSTGITGWRALLREYEDHLRKNRGLAENSLHVYVPLIRSFLAAQAGRSGRVSRRSFSPLAIRDFVVAHIQNRSAEYVRLLGTALRSFLRFLFMSGRMPRDLSSSVPTICKYRHTVPPTFLRQEEVERILTKTDRSTSTGRRDYAILLLLARLGLRAGEIVALELDDLLWRTGEIVIHGKGKIVDRLPLLSEIGDALVTYLRNDRGGSPSRRVFLRRWAPRVGLTGPAAVGHIVRRALVRADIHRSGRGAAHLFRHGLATKMIRRGASMAEIAELLRHRSQTTTAVYTQVSFEALRSVALPWPAAGGAK